MDTPKDPKNEQGQIPPQDPKTPPEETKSPENQEQKPPEGGQGGQQQQQPEGGGGKKPEDEEVVKVPKKTYNQLLQTQNLARNQQRTINRLKGGKQSPTVTPEQPQYSLDEEQEQQPNQAEMAQAQASEHAKVKSMLSVEIINNSDYQAVIKDNPTLQRVLASDPTAILTAEERENLNFAEDAVDAVKSYLDTEVSKKKQQTEDAKPGEEQPQGKEFQTGPANPPAAQIPDQQPPETDYDKGKKKGGIDGVKNMIRSKVAVK